jgi:hypothetical protein
MRDMNALQRRAVRFDMYCRESWATLSNNITDLEGLAFDCGRMVLQQLGMRCCANIAVIVISKFKHFSGIVSKVIDCVCVCVFV